MLSRAGRARARRPRPRARTPPRTDPGWAPRPSRARPARCRTAARGCGPRPRARSTRTRPPPTPRWRSASASRSSTRTFTSTWGSLRIASPATSGRSPSARSIRSAAAMPSPEGVSRMSTMWPDCSPPSTQSRRKSSSTTCRSPTSVVATSMPASPMRLVESEVRHHRDRDAVARAARRGASGPARSRR